MLPYNPKSRDSVIRYAKKLKNKSLKEVCDEGIIFNNNDGKGNYGVFIEEFYFGYKPNSNPAPDFPDAEPGNGLELKVTGLNKYVNNKGFKIKERLALKSVNFHKDYKHTFLSSPLYQKCKNLLIIFYIWDKNIATEEQMIKLIDTWSFPKNDLKTIMRDYDIINEKIRKGEAHQLSSGDTNYLEASTTGGGHGKTECQPFSDTPAKPRRYALKGKYMNHILANLLVEKYDKKEQSEFKECIKKYQNLSPIKIDINQRKVKSLDDMVCDRLNKFINKTDDEIASLVKLNYVKKDKGFYSRMVKKILTGCENDVIEFTKADIELKAVRIELNNKIKENISYKAFRFIEDIYDVDWEDSVWCNMIEKKYLFVFFKITKEGNSILEKFRFWNMPYNDRKECEKVWLKTKDIISSGEIFKDYARNKNGDPIKNPKFGNFKRENNFPKPNENPICHVRPHGADSMDMYPLPVEDKKLKFLEPDACKQYAKKSFWLKNTYIRDAVYLK